MSISDLPSAVYLIGGFGCVSLVELSREFGCGEAEPVGIQASEAAHIAAGEFRRTQNTILRYGQIPNLRHSPATALWPCAACSRHVVRKVSNGCERG